MRNYSAAFTISRNNVQCDALMLGEDTDKQNRSTRWIIEKDMKSKTQMMAHDILAANWAQGEREAFCYKKYK